MAVGAALAGRRSELDLVTKAITGASGCPVVLIAGDPGIGKTRLLATATNRCGEVGVVVLTGWCLKQAQNLPLLPIADIIHQLAEHDGGATIKAALAECPAFVPQELIRLAPELAGPDDSLTPMGTGGGELRRRLFDAIRWLLSALPSVGKCAIAIEDLHWADATTLEFLDYLFTPGHVPGLPVIVTCRSDEAAAEPLAEWLEKVRRGGHLTHLDLPPLTLTETADQIELLRNSRPVAAAVESVYARSEGNPFFTEQLVSLAETDQAGLPPGLSALLLSRATRVEGAGRSALNALAVAARPLTETDLASICGYELDQIRGALHELLAERLIQRPDERGAYRLRHALLAEAISAELLPGHRSDVHGRIAEAMAAWEDDAVAGEVADHYAGAGRTALELSWRVRAAGRAEAVFAPQEAAAQWQRVIELWERVPGAEFVAGLSAVDVHLRAMQSLANAGSFTEAFELAVRARSRLVGKASLADQVRLHSAVGHHSHRESEVGFEALASAIEIGESLPPSREYVSALRVYGGRLGDRGRFDRRRDLWWRAATTAEQYGYLAEQKAAMSDLVWHPLIADDLPATEKQVADTLAIRLDAADAIADLYPLVTITDQLLKLGKLNDIISLAAPVIQRAEDTGLTNTLLMNILRGNAHEALIELGQVSRSAAMLDAVPREQPQRGNLAICMVKAESDLLRGRFEDAAALWIDNSAVMETDLHFDVWYNLALRRLEFDIWRGQPATSLEWAVGVLEHNVTHGQDVLSGDLFALVMRACADIAEAARAASDERLRARALAGAQHLVDLVATAPESPFAERKVMVNNRAYGRSWQAELTRVPGESDAVAWAQAVAAWDNLGRPFRAAYARWRRAEAILAQRGSRAEASQLLRAAAQQSSEHVPLNAAIRGLARVARVDLVSATPEPIATTSPGREQFGLTEREREVLRLVAQGKTNAEIGKALYISAKTASVHVTNILRKLDVSSRVAAATMAQRSGLLDD